jgi:hypothetical protein
VAAVEAVEEEDAVVGEVGDEVDVEAVGFLRTPIGRRVDSECA